MSCAAAQAQMSWRFSAAAISSGNWCGVQANTGQPSEARIAAHTKQMVRNRLIEHKLYIAKHGDDMPAIRDWHP